MREATTMQWGSGRLWALLPLVLAIPLLWPHLPPLIDLLGHIGRYRIQIEPDNPYITQFFAVEWQVLPNLGVDILVALLAPLIGLEPAVKLVVTLIPVLAGAGILFIAREVHGRIPPTALFALPLAYAWPFQNGFTNYCLSMALALLAFGLWLRLTRLGKHRLRNALFLLIAPLLWITHLYGWCALGLMVFGSTVVQARASGQTWFRSIETAIVACLPLSLPLIASIIWRKQGVGGVDEWFNFRMVGTWLVTVLRDRWQWLDMPSAALLYGLAASPLLLPRLLRFEWSLAVPALLFWISAILLPNVVAGSYFAGVRLIPYALILTLIAIRPSPSAPAKFARGLMIVGALFLTVRVAAQTASYAIADTRNRSDLEALTHIARGSRIVALVGQRCGNWPAARHLHLAEMAAARRDSFTNGHWDIAGGQMIDVTYRAGAPFAVDPSQFVDVSGCSDRVDRLATHFKRIPLDAFDYLWVVEVPAAEWPKDARLQRIWNNDGSALYRIMPVVAPRQRRP
jgi:hypothetical protein